MQTYRRAPELSNEERIVNIIALYDLIGNNTFMQIAEGNFSQLLADQS